MYVYIYVCVCVIMLFKPHKLICIHKHTFISIHTHISCVIMVFKPHIFIYIHKHTFISTHTHISVYIDIYTHIHKYTHICIYIYMQFIMICHDLNSEFLPVPPANLLYCSSFKIKNFLTSFWVISSFSSAAWEIWGQ
jgi:hypothetical protein